MRDERQGDKETRRQETGDRRVTPQNGVEWVL
jgi:hypothetical protein